MPPKQGLLEPDPLTGLSKLTGRPIVLPPRPQGLNRPEPFKAELITGTNNILLIVIDYPDLPATQTAASFTDMVNGPWPTGSLDDYYQEVSYGVFGLSGETVGWYRAANNHTYYANFDGIADTDDDFGVGAYPYNAPRLVEEAVDAAEAAGVDFSNFDNDGDGFVDTVFIVHAGQGGEATDDPNDIWSHKWSISSGGGTARYYDGVTINVYTMQPELNSMGGHIEIGVFAHEYGHVLGLPDLYDTDGSSEGIGNYGLMAGGSWGANGASPERPSHMCAWSKVYLQWITPTVVTQDTSSQTISQIETNPEAYKLWKDGVPQQEYFLVSNRQKVGFDSRFIGNGGLLIWHIDEDVINANLWWNTVNNDENHKGVDLEEADGLNDLDFRRNRGDAGDFYPGSTNNTVFNDTSNPNSRDYSGVTTKVEVINISSSGDPMRADIKVGFAEPENEPPNTPSAPTGPDSGTPGSPYTFSATTTDPDGDDIAFKFDWGDGSQSDWTSFVASGSSASKSHSWSDQGTYEVRAKAKDVYGAESGWSAGHQIVVTAPILEVDPSSLDFGELGKGSSQTMTFRAYNAGGGTLSGTLSANRNWITVSPTSFEGNDNQISVTVETTELTESLSPHTGMVTVTSNGGTKTVEILVTVIPAGVVAYPNPFSLTSHTSLIFWGTSVRYAEIQIFTTAGELVRTLVETGGAGRLSWDGRNEEGDQAARGIYIYIVEGSRGRVAVLR